MSPKESSSSSNHNNCYGEAIARRANVLASCYVSDAQTTFLKGFHYSTTFADGRGQQLITYISQGQSGFPEVSSGLPSPPSSPPLAALTTTSTSNDDSPLASITKKQQIKKTTRDVNGGGGSVRARGGQKTATYIIREECERLFCETLKNVFSGEGEAFGNDSYGLVCDDLNPDVAEMHMNHSEDDYDCDKQDILLRHHDENRNNRNVVRHGIMVTAWFELWDYVGGASFRGFVAGEGSERCLFTFFDAAVVGHDLKQGLMAIIELASSAFDCEQLIICLDRDVPEADSKALMKSLRWVGFELVTLAMWSKGQKSSTSDKWLFLGMEL